MKRLIVLATVLLALVGGGLIIDATKANGGIITNVIGDGGGGGWQPCRLDWNAWNYAYMADTIQGVYGTRYYLCIPRSGGGWYIWDYIHGAYFRNTVGIGNPWWTMTQEYTSAWSPA